MKILWMIMLCMAIGLETGAAQKKMNDVGIYRTLEDFKNNTVTQRLSTNSGKVFRKNTDRSIILKDESARTRYAFGDIFGYFKNGDRYRAFGERKLFSAYGYAKIIDTRGIYLYSSYYSSYKVGRTHYFYSRSLDEPVKSLNKRNLRKDFSDSPAFIEVINAMQSSKLSAKTQTGYLLNDLYQTLVKNEQR